ncbi:MAG: laccase domain-containing protein [Microthrixaceae bacterium]|nr:laccase domain-containing protein [Microthrixaceae bacterium]
MGPHTGDGAAWVFSTRADGDLAVDAPGVDGARSRLLAAAGGPAVPWSWLRQVHGARVVVADRPAAHEGTEADAIVAERPGVPVAVQTADCGAVVLTSPEGVVAAAHAGWRGLAAGVVQATVAAMRDRGAGAVTAHVGPMIHPECYEFGAEDLAAVADVLGPTVVGRTAGGSPALDVPAAVDAARARAGVAVASRSPGCTACDPQRWYSHRARREAGRMAAVVWAT